MIAYSAFVPRLFIAVFFTMVWLSPSLSQQPHNSFEFEGSSPVPVADARISGGFWHQRLEVNRTKSIPFLLELAESPELSNVVRNFELAAGWKEGSRKGTHWQDAWLYKVIESASYVLAEQPDPVLDHKVDSLVEIIAAAQDDDGYIATQVQLTGYKRFQDPQLHEFYTMGHLLTAAAAHYRVTGKRQLLEVAIRCANYLHDTLAGNETVFSEFPQNPSVIMGAVDLYRVTGQPGHLELARMVVDLRGSKYTEESTRPYWAKEMLTGSSDLKQNYKPLRLEDEVLGHAVFFTYLYAGATDVFMETGDSTLLVALERLWEDLTQTKMYITGGVSPEHKALPTRKTGDHHREIIVGDRIHEGVAGPYHLPNATAYNETCGQVGNFMWNWRMLLVTGDPAHAEVMEKSIYNSILSGVELDGTGWFYTNPLEWHGADHVLLNHDARKRFDPGLRQICCPTNLTRTVAHYPSFLYSVSGSTLWVHQYAENELSTEIPGYGALSLKQTTSYPWDGTVRMEITGASRAKKMTLKLRIPSWAKGATVMVNGEPVEGVEAGSYVSLENKFKQGDQVTVNLPLQVKLYRAHPNFEHLTNQVAVQRGPVVYCMESTDMPGDVEFDAVSIRAGADWKIRSSPTLLEGVPVLETTGAVVPLTTAGQAYAPLEDYEITPVRVRMIPYFAWNNRGEPKMKVWLPVMW